MPAKLSTIVSRIGTVANRTNANLLEEFLAYLRETGASERHQGNELLAMLYFSQYLGLQRTFRDIENKQDIVSFLDSKRKSKVSDPDERWITTWNDYLGTVKHFFRWLYNQQGKAELIPTTEWDTPAFAQIKKKRSKRLSPYSESEIWDLDELLLIVKYEAHPRNKAALTLFWDLDARNHEVTLLKLKNIRLREKYGEGEVPYESKTGSGPILLTVSFPYVRDLINIHPRRDDPDSHLICNLMDGSPLRPDAMWRMMKQLRKRIVRFLRQGTVGSDDDRTKLESLVRTKKWNPYCLRHSAITHDSDYLPGYALNKKVRWSMNSKQPARYIKNRMGETLKNVILEHNGIRSEDAQKATPVLRNCPRCFVTNALETKYCGKCSYPLTQEAYEDARTEEEKLISELQRKLAQMKEDNDKRYLQVMSLIRLNPVLSNLKPEALAKLSAERIQRREERVY